MPRADRSPGPQESDGEGDGCGHDCGRRRPRPVASSQPARRTHKVGGSYLPRRPSPVRGRTEYADVGDRVAPEHREGTHHRSRPQIGNECRRHRPHGNLTSTPPGDLWCGWTLRDTSAHVYHLGTFHLAAGAAVKIHTGRGPTPRPTGTRTPATTSGTTPATPQPSRTPTTSSSTAATTPPPPTPKRPADQRCLRQDASRLGSSWCAPREPGDHCEGVA